MDNRKLVTAEVDGRELACILMEAVLGNTRPPHVTPHEFMDTIEKLDPMVFKAYIRAAKAAAMYMAANLQDALDKAGVGGTLQ